MSTTLTPELLDFELPNLGPGPDAYSPAGSDADYLVILLQRDYYCRQCRRQVQGIKRRYEEFEAKGIEVASVLPNEPGRAVDWQTTYDLPFPLLADPGTELGDEFGQPTRFGVLGELHNVVGRLPEALVIDLSTGEILLDHAGQSRDDRPGVDELLAAVE